MYIHLGSSMAVRDSTLIGIFDLDNTTISKHTRAFLERNQDEGQLVDVSDDIPKAFIVTSEYGMERVFLTQMASSTLAKRAQRRK